jgi:hypothetical protein
MAKKSPQPTTTADEYEQMFPNWVYQVPGFVLIVAGFGGIAFLTLF